MKITTCLGCIAAIGLLTTSPVAASSSHLRGPALRREAFHDVFPNEGSQHIFANRAKHIFKRAIRERWNPLRGILIFCGHEGPAGRAHCEYLFVERSDRVTRCGSGTVRANARFLIVNWRVGASCGEF
jgi:hypothetical protein